MREVARGGLGIDTRGDIRSTITLYLAGCPRVASLSHYIGSDVRVPSIAARIVPFVRNLRRWESNLRFLELIQPGSVAQEIRPPSFPHLASGRGKIVGLIPVAPWKGRLWVPDRWREVIKALRAGGHDLKCLCGPGQEAMAKVQAGDVEVAACGSIDDWARALSACRLVVTLDTGPMHLADALGIPVVALFGPGLLPLWAPSGRESTVVAHQDGPDGVVCHQVDSNIELGRMSMERISVEEVLSAVRKRLENS